jgi:ABC transporter substrate binding protein
MNRRRFVSGAVCGLLGMPRVAPAQSAGRVPRIGWLGGGAGRSSAEMLRSTQFKAFADGLREHGLVVGHSVLVDLRMIAPDKVEQYAEVATRLAAEVDVIFAANPFSLAAATQATKTVPIVGVDVESDPVRQGWAATLARPGANVSGFFLDMPEMSGKHVEFLRVVKPGVARMAVLGDPRVNALQFEATDAAARDAGLPLHQVMVQSPRDVRARDRGSRAAPGRRARGPHVAPDQQRGAADRPGHPEAPAALDLRVRADVRGGGRPPRLRS